MQRRYLLSCCAFVLATAVNTPPAAAEATGSRTVPSTALKEKAPGASPAALAPGGLRLSLSTRMRDPVGPPATERRNPYLPVLAKAEPASRLFAPIPGTSAEGTRPGPRGLFGSLAPSIPLLPESGRSILPSIRKVYPTGEKPLVVVSFKCPTEMIGVTPPTIKLLHDLVDMGMEGINRTDLLSFNLQQVCQ